MANYSWPAPEKRKLIGKRISRLDGMAKSSGRAKYPSDVNPKGLLFGAMLTSPHAHAKIRSIDASAAEKMKGVTAVLLVAKPGMEIQWAGTELAFLAAETEPLARDAIRAIKVEYEVLEHMVKEENLGAVGTRGRAAGEQIVGDPDEAFSKAEVSIDGNYGIPVITHCCLEPHGQTIQWAGDKINYWPSTQAVSTIGGDLAKLLEVPAANINIEMDYMGGGFGSKFPADTWGEASARLSKASGGRPVKFFLERRDELTIAGVRPSHFGRIKVAATKAGDITGWQSETWSSGGFGGGGMAPLPYVFTNIPNKRLNHTAVSLNTGMSRAWRAPNHPQASFLTCAALEDLAAKLGMDPVELFRRNLKYTAREPVYARQLTKAMDMIGWKQHWHPRGQGSSGHMKRGLGLGIATWGGAGHASECDVKIHPDGSVELEMGTQDLGVGTRTVVAIVVAETLGLALNQVKVNIGRNAYANSGPSGGSTTVGGVSSSARKAATDALNKLLETVAPSLGAPVDQIEAVDGKLQVVGNPAKSIAWKAACAKLQTSPITARGVNNPKNTMGLNTQGAGGIQMADVTVDIETGVVRMNKLVAVQDCGLVLNLKTAESQVFGAGIMSICGALMEERITDQITGRVLNADMEFYKLAGIKDIGEIEVHMEQIPDSERRGVVGLGEPCAIAGIAAIANAVANAIGVRVPEVPLTPNRVLAALYGADMNQNRSRA
jgi:xanthine dehydrogenase YagR molybdenum-binding subunit